MDNSAEDATADQSPTKDQEQELAVNVSNEDNIQQPATEELPENEPSLDGQCNKDLSFSVKDLPGLTVYFS